MLHTGCLVATLDWEAEGTGKNDILDIYFFGLVTLHPGCSYDLAKENHGFAFSFAHGLKS